VDGQNVTRNNIRWKGHKSTIKKPLHIISSTQAGKFSRLTEVNFDYRWLYLSIVKIWGETINTMLLLLRVITGPK